MKFDKRKYMLFPVYKTVFKRVLLFFIMLAAQPHFAIAEESKAILKVIHNERVRSIMLRLNSLLYERELTQLEVQQLRYKQINNLVSEANKLTSTAASLPDVYSINELSDEQQLAFNAMANELYEVSLELQREAKAGHRKAADDAYTRLQETCHTCHSLFRNW